MSQKFATIFFTRLYILDFLNKKQQTSVTSELLPISSYVTDIYYLFLFELFLIITMYQVTDIYYYFKLLQISVTLDLISNSYKVTDTQQPIYLIACHALPNQLRDYCCKGSEVSFHRQQYIDIYKDCGNLKQEPQK